VKSWDPWGKWLKKVQAEWSRSILLKRGKIGGEHWLIHHGKGDTGRIEGKKKDVRGERVFKLKKLRGSHDSVE